MNKSIRSARSDTPRPRRLHREQPLSQIDHESTAEIKKERHNRRPAEALPQTHSSVGEDVRSAPAAGEGPGAPTGGRGPASAPQRVAPENADAAHF